MVSDKLRESVVERRYLTALAMGDQSALGGIYQIYGERIFRYTFRILGNRSDAEDATVEIFLRVARKAEELRTDGAFRAWLFRIARNLCNDMRRARRVTLELTIDMQPVDWEERRAIKMTVQKALGDLPVEYREPLVLCDLEDISAREAAEILRISVPALKARLYRGRRALRYKLSDLFSMPESDVCSV